MDKISKLGRLLAERKVSMYRLACDLDIPYPTIHRVCTNPRYSIGISKAIRICKYLQIPITIFIDDNTGKT